jgi:hypothetical protein
MNAAFATPLVITPAAVGAPLVVSVRELRDDTGVTRTMTLDGVEVDFRIEGPVLPPPLETSDFAAIAAIFTAMRLRRPLHVAGKVSRTLLANLEEFQAAWHAWLPGQYVPVPLSADEEIAIQRTSLGRSVVAFSGGVDSAYAMLLHARTLAGRRTVPPAAGVLIHGLDIPLEEKAGFANAENAARSMLESISVPLATVRTNWRARLCHNWRMEHMAGIAAALNQFQGVADSAIVGSDEGYDKIDIPWGSNYVTNPLLGGAGMTLRTEGGDCTRSDRVAFIAANSSMAGKLRVCWEHTTGGNCGKCEKCISTQLNFRAVGLEPQGFAHIAGLTRIAFAPIRSRGDLYFLLESQRSARLRRINGAWRFAAWVAIARHIAARPVLAVLDAIKAAIRRNDRLHTSLRGIAARIPHV